MSVEREPRAREAGAHTYDVSSGAEGARGGAARARARMLTATEYPMASSTNDSSALNGCSMKGRYFIMS